MRALWFGTYSLGGGYPRNTILMDALRTTGADVRECHAPLFRDAFDKVAAASTKGGLLRAGVRGLVAWARLAARFYRAGPRDVVVVGYTGHADLYLARALSIVWRRPVVLDAFLSPYDTVVHDRGLLPADSWRAKALFGLERGALRLADLVLTDTEAHADFMAETFRVPRRRFAAVPVGSLVRRAVPVRVPALVHTEPWQRRFTALFVGTFVPLQGVPYILDAAARAPEIRFRLVGDGPGADRIAEELAARDMANVTFVRRFIPRSELEEELGAADAALGVFGTTPKADRVVPCKVYDGLAAGRPVVTGDAPGARELLRDGTDALLVDRADPAALVRALRRLRDEPGLEERLAGGARAVARERFSPEALGMRLRAYLAEVARR